MIDFDERAAILEFDGGMTRADAEAQAFREVYAERLAMPSPGILGELIVATSRRYSPSLATEIEAQGLDCARVTWGYGWVVPIGSTYRPADGGEPARSAVIVPAIEGGGLVDLVAQDLASRALLTRLGAASIIGADEIARAIAIECPLYIFSSPLAWLRGGARGAVVLDWPNVGRELEGVEKIICSESIAARLYSGTRKCFPVPAIATPALTENRLAA